MTIEQPALQLVADLLDEAELADMVQAALEGRVALVPVAIKPEPDEVCELHLRAPGVAGDVVVSAVLAGDEMGGLYPFLLQPVRDEDVPGLEVFVAAVRKSWLPRPRSMVRSVPDDGEREEAPTITINGEEDTDEDTLIGRTLGGRYEILSLIGEGGMGRVYAARHLALDKKIAIKVLHAFRQGNAELSEQFHHEALAASQLDHPNVMHVTDFGEEPDGRLYIAMELLVGRTLSSLIEEKRRLSVEQTIEIVAQVCSALAVAHERGIVHRDMKPDNVVLVSKQDENGAIVETVKVCDFGLAKITGNLGAKRLRSSMEGTVRGTPEYMSPEQARGELVDARTDLYACGVMLYEMSTGTVPHTADTPIGILTRHVTDAPKPPRERVPELSPAFEAVILKAIEKDRDQRYQTARELRDALRSVLAPARGTPVAPAVLQFTEPQASSDSGTFGNQSFNDKHRAVAERQADALAENAEPMLRALDAMTDLERYGAAMAQLARVMRVLAARGHAESLWQILSRLDQHAKGAAPGNTSREGFAARALHSLRETDALEPIARAVFSAKQQTREAARGVIVAAGTAGADALCKVRATSATAPGNRPRFVAVLKDVGPRAAPAIARALARLPDTSDFDRELAEDLLRGAPTVAEKDIAHQVTRFITVLDTPVRRAAVAALIGVAGPKAVDHLVTALGDADEGVRVAALAGLRRGGAVTREVVEQIGLIAGPKVEASEELRAAALAALTDAKPEARAAAFSVLMAALEPRSATFVGMLRGDTTSRDSGLAVETAAAVMLKVGGAEGRKFVEKRMNASKGDLKERLAKLLRG